MNIELFEGQSCLVHVKLPEEWEVYGGTPKGEFRSERESADSVLVTVPAMEAEFTPLVPYELFARRILDGKEWLVLSGQLHVRRRYSDAGGGISAIEYFVEPKLVEDGISSSPQIIVGIPGPHGPMGDKGDPGEGGMTAEERATLAGAAQREGDNTFTAANTFTGSVDMSGASVTPPSGWNVGELTAEEVQAVAPISWDYYSVRFGNNATGGNSGTAFGSHAYSFSNSVGVGLRAKAVSYSVAVGSDAIANNNPNTVTIGAAFSDTAGSYTCTTEGTGSITIGAGANTLNNGTTESSNSVTIGCKAENKGADSVVIGAQARNASSASVAIGTGAVAASIKGTSIGAKATSSFNGFSAGYDSLTNGINSVAIGAGAKSYASNTVLAGSAATITNTGGTPSDNTIVIGYGATASAPNAVVLGAGASVLNAGSSSIGAAASANLGGNSIGKESYAGVYAQAMGFKAKANGAYSVSLGNETEVKTNFGVAIGHGAKVNDIGATVIRSHAPDGTYTQLYFSGANTPLANTYEGGAPMLGYVTKDSAGNVVAAGTRSLIELLTNNSTFAPASLDENGEWVMPKVFHPSDLDLPIEESTEPEDVEINIPEPEVEEYQPLPVWPIVEPDDIMGDNGTLEQGGTENTSPETNS